MSAKPLTIHIYNNAEKHRQKMAEVMEKFGVKTGPLIETIIESFTYEDWEKYSKLTKETRSINNTKNEFVKAIRGLSEEDISKLLNSVQELGINLNNESNL